MSYTVQNIYDVINAASPFMTQEQWDNSGLLVGSPQQKAEKVLVTLDISCKAVEEACRQGCDVIVSHHPVIFSPLKKIPCESPVYQLVMHQISAICCHTPLDIAKGGINDLIVERLRGCLDMEDMAEPLDAVGCGRIVTFTKAYTAKEIAYAGKQALQCNMVRYAGERDIRRLGICSGSGASMLEEVAGYCDALLTGDVKHDRWYRAQELGLGLIDCGHYATEVIMIPYVAELLRAALPGLEVMKYAEDPASYI